MRLQSLVAMAPRILVPEVVDFHKQLVVVEMDMVVEVGSHMELEVEVMVMVMVAVANCNELAGVVMGSCNELVAAVVNGKLLGAGAKLLVVVEVMVMAGACNELEVEARGMEGEVVLYKVVEEVLYKVVAMVGEVNRLAGVVAAIGMDK